MSTPVILDAGPVLNIFGAGREELLFAVVAAISGELCMPKVVHGEVQRRSRNDKRFSGVNRRVERAVAAGTVEILPDEQDPDRKLAARAEHYQRRLAVLARRGDKPLTRADLGESLVLAHADRIRASGQTVWVVIDEWRAQEVARDAGIRYISTETILLKAAKLGLIASVSEMKALWEKLRTLDNGLVHWTQVPRLHQANRYGEEAHPLISQVV